VGFPAVELSLLVLVIVFSAQIALLDTSATWEQARKQRAPFPLQGRSSPRYHPRGVLVSFLCIVVFCPTAPDRGIPPAKKMLPPFGRLLCPPSPSCRTSFTSFPPPLYHLINSGHFGICGRSFLSNPGLFPDTALFFFCQ